MCVCALSWPRLKHLGGEEGRINVLGFAKQDYSSVT